ncbi:hypothetical protein RHSIM_Rhsim01G0123400 [Rhododendron simsii]|uniref:Uncharacterized protein n=1 Tax=Rhododendron simsii TaxID=118357 RepID=A0A834HJ43_RHOSS|nr:hypothetical protein RHSIM_Rhsim01G0123400 [Rhododendron simsii]
MPEFLRLTGFGDGRRNWWVEEIWVLWRVGEEDRMGLMSEASNGIWRVPPTWMFCGESVMNDHGFGKGLVCVWLRMASFRLAFLAEAGRLFVTDLAGKPAQFFS